MQAAFAVRAQDDVFLGTAVDVQRDRVARQRINQRVHQRLLRPPKPKLRVLLYPLLVLRGDEAWDYLSAPESPNYPNIFHKQPEALP